MIVGFRLLPVKNGIDAGVSTNVLLPFILDNNADSSHTVND